MSMMVLLTVFTVLLFSSPMCRGGIHQTFDTLPRIQYDFVILGGGTAGSVIANRLTEDPRFSVLVIEAGPTNEGAFETQVPFFSPRLVSTMYDWNFTTTPQVGLNGRSLEYPRGHILGGSSSINGMFYTRGSSSDFNRWADVTEDSGWSWENILPYILKNEKWTTPADHHNTSGQFNPAAHNFSGVNSVSLSGFPRPIDARVIQTTQELKEEFPFVLDMNEGTPLGVGWLQATIGNGARSSAATSYLAPKFSSRSNLDIVVNTRVTRVLRTSNSKDQVFRTAEISIGDSTQTITAKKELILTAGTIGTPHILLSSGIGDANELKQIGIPSVLHNPSVGKNLTEQPRVFLPWAVNSTNTGDNLKSNATLLAEALAQWNATRMGPLVDAGVNHVAWKRIDKDSPIFKSFADPSSGSNTPHIEIAIANDASFTSLQGNFASAGVVIVTPLSRGSVTLNSTNPLDPPVIDFGFLTSEFDILAMREGVASARRFFAAPAWKGYILEPAGGFANATTDALLDEFVRNNALGAAHPVGAAAMSAKGASYGVVDPDLLLKGAKGLRIADASIMPFITCGHTQAPVYAIAERAADLIKAAWEA